MIKKLFSLSGIAVILVVFLVINLVATYTLKSQRMDLTENQLYTLSEGTKRIVSSLEKDVSVRLFYSKKLLADVPLLNGYGQRVLELLEAYENLSNGRLRLEVIDPIPFTPEEDEAVANGLQALPINAGGEAVYLGLVVARGAQQEVIAYLDPNREDTLEYDITKLVYTLANDDQQVLGLLSSLPLRAMGMNPFTPAAQQSRDWIVLSQLEQLFQVRDIASDAQVINDDIDVLMLVHPKELSEQTLYAIDQYVLRGGRVMVFVDPHAEEDSPAGMNPMMGMGSPRHSDLERLFKTWGIDYDKSKVVGDIGIAQRVTVNNRGRPQAADYVLWLAMNERNINQDDFATKDLQQINIASSGYIAKSEAAQMRFTPLLTTTDQAMLIEAEQLNFGPDPMGLLRNYQPGHQAYVVAARVEGQFKSAFPQGAPPAEVKEGEDESAESEPREEVELPAFISESESPSTILVFADTDILRDASWVNVRNFFGQVLAVPMAGNGNLIINAVDHLTGSNDLISLRSRGRSIKPFERVIELQKQAEAQYRDREQALQTRLEEAQTKINELQSQNQNADSQLLSPEQEVELEKFRQELLNVRKQLRDVQHELRSNIEGLGQTIKLLNIVIVPLLVALVAVILGYVRNKRRYTMASA